MSRRIQDERTRAARRRGPRNRIRAKLRAASERIFSAVMGGEMRFSEVRPAIGESVVKVMAEELAGSFMSRILKTIGPPKLYEKIDGKLILIGGVTRCDISWGKTP
jgi:hypothetical protein